MKTPRRVLDRAAELLLVVAGKSGWFNRPPGRLNRRAMKSLSRMGVIERELVSERSTRRYVYRTIR